MNCLKIKLKSIIFTILVFTSLLLLICEPVDENNLFLLIFSKILGFIFIYITYKLHNKWKA